MAESSAPDKLSIVLYAGDYGRVHYALAMASAAAAPHSAPGAGPALCSDWSSTV